ncbi:hypothetical protein C5E43_27550 [Nocardia cyriacigeorgica]|nr:hypothetical protein C5B73_27640 [Nocardia cyriacigeorgica]PPJ01907.1 hypothetical protein C5E43_27550 [Nocardia cyriacigeorgica]
MIAHRHAQLMSGGVQFADRFAQNSRTPTAPEVSNVLDLALHRRHSFYGRDSARLLNGEGVIALS